jgi:hypothetical protein
LDELVSLLSVLFLSLLNETKTESSATEHLKTAEDCLESNSTASLKEKRRR